VAPLVCGTLGERVGWHYGFGAAGVGMLIGGAGYLRGRRWLPRSTPVSATPSGERVPWTRDDRRALLLLLATLPLIAGAQVGNQQMFNAYVLWGEQRLALQWHGWEMPVTWLLSMDALIAALMTMATFAFWRAWGRRRREPDEVVKIAIGAAIMVLAPLVLALAGYVTPAGERVPLLWAFAFHVVNEIGFAMVVPIGLALYSRAAPAQTAGLMIGSFYLSFALCNVGVGRLGGLLESMDGNAFWLLHAGIVAIAALGLAAAARFGRGLLAPVDPGVKVEPPGV
jgi:POT family proton-dependent oligopeptide transporter